MRLRLLRFECDIQLSNEWVTTLQIEDRRLFTRLVKALVEETGEYGEEPYLLFDAGDARISPKKAMLVVKELPTVPLNDRALLGRLYKQVRGLVESDSNEYEMVRDLSNRLRCALEDCCSSLWGDYSLSTAWDLETYFKSFSLAPLVNEGDSLLDNCIRLFGLCADVMRETPIVVVNAKSFFAENELQELLEQAVFYGIELFLIESWDDPDSHPLERKYLIDQHFLVTAP